MKTLLFKTGDEDFILDFSQIQKVLESPVIYPIPLAPLYFSGALNFHNHIIPVLDLAKYLNVYSQERDSRIIVLDLKKYRLALKVSSIEGHTVLEELKPLPGTSSSLLSSISRLVIKDDGQALRLLQPAELKDLLSSDLLAQNGGGFCPGESGSQACQIEPDQASTEPVIPVLPSEYSCSIEPHSGRR